MLLMDCIAHDRGRTKDVSPKGRSLQGRARASQRRDDAAGRIVVGEDRGVRPLRRRLAPVRRRKHLDHSAEGVVRHDGQRSRAPQRAHQRQPTLRNIVIYKRAVRGNACLSALCKRRSCVLSYYQQYPRNCCFEAAFQLVNCRA